MRLSRRSVSGERVSRRLVSSAGLIVRRRRESPRETRSLNVTKDWPNTHERSPVFERFSVCTEAAQPRHSLAPELAGWELGVSLWFAVEMDVAEWLEGVTGTYNTVAPSTTVLLIVAMRRRLPSSACELRIRRGDRSQPREQWPGRTCRQPAATLESARVLP